MDGNQTLSPAEFAEQIGRHRDFVIAEIRAGSIVAHDFRRTGAKLPRYSIDASEVTRWLTNKENAAKYGHLLPSGQLPDTTTGTKRKRPRLSKIYFLFDGEALVYIGKTIDLNKRTAQHKPLKAFDRVEHKTVPTRDVDDLERALIAFYKPPLNKSFVRGDHTKHEWILNTYGFSVTR